MKRIIVVLVCSGVFILLLAAGFAPEDIRTHPTCRVCGMDRMQHASNRMLLKYDDGTSEGTCSTHCTAAWMAAHREKTIVGMYVADHDTKELVDARKAFWVIGGDEQGVMSGRAKSAFEEKAAAEVFMEKHGGTLATYNDAMSAAFADMSDDIRKLREQNRTGGAGLMDIKTHPGCRYCGMDRQMYDYSRMLVEYEDGAAVGTCSIHCTAIDLALSPGRVPGAIKAGDYRTRRLIDAERCYWVVGGDRQGVMSIRGKWAFEKREDATAFISEHGGNIGSFDDALQAAFEDMWEILR